MCSIRRPGVWATPLPGRTGCPAGTDLAHHRPDAGGRGIDGVRAITRAATLPRPLGEGRGECSEGREIVRMIIAHCVKPDGYALLCQGKLESSSSEQSRKFRFSLLAADRRSP